jgi:hypothetical protein
MSKEIINLSKEVKKLVIDEYNFVEQLKRTVAKISLLSLILSSELYQKAL